MRFSIDFYDPKSLNNVLDLLKSKKISFQEVVEYTKTKKYTNRNFLSLLASEQFFKYLLKENLLSKTELKYLLDNIKLDTQLKTLTENSYLFHHLLLGKDISFKELVDVFNSKHFKYNSFYSGLYYLVSNTVFDCKFAYLIKNNILSKGDFKYLLGKIDDPDIITSLLMRKSKFLDYCFKNFLVDKHIIEKFDELIKDAQMTFLSSLLKPYEEMSLTTIKDYVLVSSLPYADDKKESIFNMIQNSDRAQSTLMQILDNNLIDQYDFEQLENLLNKDEEKKKIKMNL